jgi:SSS family solute:Na+ symporter
VVFAAATDILRASFAVSRTRVKGISMHLQLADWLIIVGYCLFSLVVGLYYSRRASKNISEFFVAGESIPWWLAGTSMVATTFASDTPLVVSGLVRKGGIYENWLWWNALIGGMLTVFFYAHLWRRAGLITDNEFNEIRYEGVSASVLRGYGAVYGGVFTNCIILGWVMLAMVKICAALFDLSGLTAWGISLTGIHIEWGKLIIISILVLMTLGYTALSGYWGVVMTDFVQFIFAMGGAIALAVIAVRHVGGPSSMVAKLADPAAGNDPKVLHFVPDFQTAGRMALMTFAIQLGIQGWLGGQGGGYIAQRLFSTKTEKDAVLAAMWFNFAQYVLRSWPWILVGLASIIVFPRVAGEDSEMAYPRMIVTFLPVGLRGLMVASLLAAFMSTVATQLNWGASYLVSDLYKRFIVRHAPEHHYVNASRVATVIITIIGALAAWQAQNIAHIWVYLITITAGNAILGLMRWYWWRINAWAEISALIAGPLLANGNVICGGLARLGLLPAKLMGPIHSFYSNDSQSYAVRLVCILAACTVIWLIVTYLTRPVSDEHLEEFYRRVRPGGWWGHIAERCPDVVVERSGSKWLGMVAGSICLGTSMFGIGNLCLGRPLLGVAWLVVAVISGYVTLAQVSPSANRRR